MSKSEPPSRPVLWPCCGVYTKFVSATPPVLWGDEPPSPLDPDVLLVPHAPAAPSSAINVIGRMRGFLPRPFAAASLLPATRVAQRAVAGHGCFSLSLLESAW